VGTTIRGERLVKHDSNKTMKLDKSYSHIIFASSISTQAIKGRNLSLSVLLAITTLTSKQVQDNDEEIHKLENITLM